MFDWLFGREVELPEFKDSCECSMCVKGSKYMPMLSGTQFFNNSGRIRVNFMRNSECTVCKYVSRDEGNEVFKPKDFLHYTCHHMFDHVEKDNRKRKEEGYPMLRNKIKVIIESN